MRPLGRVCEDERAYLPWYHLNSLAGFPQPSTNQCTCYGANGPSRADLITRYYSAFSSACSPDDFSQGTLKGFHRTALPLPRPSSLPACLVAYFFWLKRFSGGNYTGGKAQRQR
jgi:hypothetical protein